MILKNQDKCLKFDGKCLKVGFYGKREISQKLCHR